MYGINPPMWFSYFADSPNAIVAGRSDSLKMEPGDVCWMHSNTLHSSAPNNSAAWRRNVITAYNSRFNGPVPNPPVPGAQPEYSPIR
jgi:hypothetical protein